MKCLRCGYCCKNLFVPIVDDPKKGPVEGNLITHEGDGTPCKHLLGNKPGEYSCALHNYKWYKETPCFDFGQVEKSPADLCRLGVHLMKRLHDEGQHKDAPVATCPSCNPEIAETSCAVPSLFVLHGNRYKVDRSKPISFDFSSSANRKLAVDLIEGSDQ